MKHFFAVLPLYALLYGALLFAHIGQFFESAGAVLFLPSLAALSLYGKLNSRVAEYRSSNALLCGAAFAVLTVVIALSVQQIEPWLSSTRLILGMAFFGIVIFPAIIFPAIYEGERP